MFTVTKDLILPSTVTGSWPRPRWFDVSMWGKPLDTAMMDVRFREKLQDALAAELEGVGHPAVDDDAQVAFQLGVQRFTHGFDESVHDPIGLTVAVDVFHATQHRVSAAHPHVGRPRAVRVSLVVVHVREHARAEDEDKGPSEEAIDALPALEAAGRILARSQRSGMNVPPMDNSAMDGYAVRSADGDRLRIAQKIMAGSVGRPLEPGTDVDQAANGHSSNGFSLDSEPAAKKLEIPALVRYTATAWNWGRRHVQGWPAVELKPLPGVNHLLVRATTGEVSEYPTLQERTVVPEIGQTIASWLSK